MDKLSKYAHFLSSKHPYTTLDVAQLFMDNVFGLHGLPQSIVSDRDAIFLYRPKKWCKWLPLAGWWYNTSYHSAAKSTPYEILYGQTPPSLVPYMPFDSQLDSVDRSLHARESTLRTLKSLLAQAQQRMKVKADKGRFERTLAMGDWCTKIHPTFHISQLNRRVNSAYVSRIILAQVTDHGVVLLVPEAVRERRLVPRNGRLVAQVLVKWLNTAEEDIL
uniref:Uncharacterized protein LOC104211176 n=2 Tax=Nicotiana sylvestris TaxID=4096 RepID=A0A1U7V8B0_NICSY|nr:PREDICTED: uncharacterized protein LOC104211176 [Nicotiana sylvestris]